MKHNPISFSFPTLQTSFLIAEMIDNEWKPIDWRVNLMHRNRQHQGRRKYIVQKNSEYPIAPALYKKKWNTFSETILFLFMD